MCLYSFAHLAFSNYKMAALVREQNLKINASSSLVSAILKSEPRKTKWSLEEFENREVDKVEYCRGLVCTG
jgi:hypothetical protein